MAAAKSHEARKQACRQASLKHIVIVQLAVFQHVACEVLHPAAVAAGQGPAQHAGPPVGLLGYGVLDALQLSDRLNLNRTVIETENQI